MQPSLCTAPETCSCEDGYELSKENKYVCKPKCSFRCSKGKCVAPEICSCNNGYELSEGNKYICKPKCTFRCFHGKCVAPEHVLVIEDTNTAPKINTFAIQCVRHHVPEEYA